MEEIAKKASFWSRHIEGPGGIRALLPIAVPMILTSIFDTLMTFVDRMYLSYVGKEEMAACMIGGTSSWMCMTMFVGLIGYSSAIIAHYYGANRHKECPKVVYQAVLLSLASYPVILLIGWGVSYTFGYNGHAPKQVELERVYFAYMIFGGILALMRSAFSSFFAGIGKTYIVMIGNGVALLVNLVSNYVLIFGKFGFPRMEVKGAAIGTLLASLSMVLVIIFSFLSTVRKEPYYSRISFKLDREKMRTLLRFGFPNGLENMLGMASFVLTLTALHSYGADVAAATTIVFNWDSVSFFPLMGLQIGVTALVGQSMGAGKPLVAERSAYSGFKLAFSYAGVVILLFWIIPYILVGVFTPDVEGLDYGNVRELAVPMLRLASFYLLSDALYLISSGALRGAGDTFWVMVAGILIHWFIAGAVWIAVKYCGVTPMMAWLLFVLTVMFGGFIILFRFLKGGWKNIKMLADEPPVEEKP